MLAMGAPGVLLTFLVLLTVKEPLRRTDSNEPLAASTHGMRRGLRELIGLATYRNIFIAGILFNCAGGAVLAFGPAYVIREFHLTTAQAGLSYGLVTGSAGALGAITGGMAGNRLGAFDLRWPLWFVAGTLTVSAPCIVLAFLTHNYWLFLALMTVPHFAIVSHAGPTISAIQAIVGVRSRALASAVFLFGLNGIGISLGAFLAGAISDRLSYLGHAGSLRVALMMLSVMNVWGAWHYVRAGTCLRTDMKRIGQE